MVGVREEDLRAVALREKGVAVSVVGLGVFLTVTRNMSTYNGEYLHCHLKTSSTHTFKIGVASTGGSGEG